MTGHLSPVKIALNMYRAHVFLAFGFCSAKKARAKRNLHLNRSDLVPFAGPPGPTEGLKVASPEGRGSFRALLQQKPDLFAF